MMATSETLVAELRQAEGIFKEDEAAFCAGDLFGRAADALSSQSLSLSEAREALKPFAAFAKYWGGLQSPDDRKFISVGDACKLTVGDVRRARSVLEMLAASNPQSACAGEEAGQSAGEVQQQRNASSALAPSKALENGPAGLADATPKPPDPSLSSLRKGAEVAVKPLVWNEYETEGEVDRWDAETALGSFYEISTEFDGYSVSNDHVHSDQRFDTPDEAKAFAQSDYETRIRSALVSGSREDGDG